jgi:hypothetical protein
LGDFPVFLTEAGLDMKDKRYSEEQINSILKEHEAGMPAQDVWSSQRFLDT